MISITVCYELIFALFQNWCQFHFKKPKCSVANATTMTTILYVFIDVGFYLLFMVSPYKISVINWKYIRQWIIKNSLWQLFCTTEYILLLSQIIYFGRCIYFCWVYSRVYTHIKWSILIVWDGLLRILKSAVIVPRNPET